MIVELEPELVFEIESSNPILGTTIAYADSVDNAYCAYWTLRRDSGTMGTTVKVRDLTTGKVIWDA